MIAEIRRKIIEKKGITYETIPSQLSSIKENIW